MKPVLEIPKNWLTGRGVNIWSILYYGLPWVAGAIVVVGVVFFVGWFSSAISETIIESPDEIGAWFGEIVRGFREAAGK